MMRSISLGANPPADGLQRETEVLLGAGAADAVGDLGGGVVLCAAVQRAVAPCANDAHGEAGARGGRTDGGDGVGGIHSAVKETRPP